MRRLRQAAGIDALRGMLRALRGSGELERLAAALAAVAAAPLGDQGSEGVGGGDGQVTEEPAEAAAASAPAPGEEEAEAATAAAPASAAGSRAAAGSAPRRAEAMATVQLDAQGRPDTAAPPRSVYILSCSREECRAARELVRAWAELVCSAPAAAALQSPRAAYQRELAAR